MIEGLFSPMHLLVILVVALLVFGPDKLPQIGRQVGKAGREYRQIQTAVNDEVRGVLGQDALAPVSPPPDSAAGPSAATSSPANEPTPPGPGAGGPPAGGRPAPPAHSPAEGATEDTTT